MASVCDVIGIDLEVVNFAAEYKDRVFSEFLREYSAGRTPNPDILCNAEIKFRAFLDHAIALGANRIATGHYAGVRERDGRFELLTRGRRDQGPELFPAPAHQAQLSRTLFPLADTPKTEVRRIAREAGMPVHAKKDSTGICFIGERPFREFLNRYLPHAPGPMRTPEGEEVGQPHRARVLHHRPAQGHRPGRPPRRRRHAWYVAGKDIAANALIVVQGHDHPLLQSRSLRAADLAWVAARRRMRTTRTAARRATGRAMRRAASTRSRAIRSTVDVRCAAVGGHAGAVGGALQRRGVSGRRRDPVARAPASAE